MNQYEIEQKLKHYLARSRYSQAQFARELGYHPSTVTKWISGVNRIPMDVLLILCQKLSLNKEEQAELFNLIGYDLSLIEVFPARENVVALNTTPNTWSGKVDIELSGLELIRGYDLWFTSEATGQWRIWHLDSKLGQVYPVNFELDDESKALSQFAPAISPDNSTIAFSAGWCVTEGTYIRNLFTARIDGSNVCKLTASMMDHYHPSWSPDGMQLIFSKGSFNNPFHPDLGYGLWMINVKNGQAQQLSDKGDYDPSWSPDGRYVAYHSKEESWNITILDLLDYDGNVNSCSTWVAADAGSIASGASWVNENKLVFASQLGGKWEIYEMPIIPNRTLVNPTRLTYNLWDNLYPVAFDEKLMIWQAFQHESVGEEGPTTDRIAVLYVMDLQTHQQAPLITGIGNARNGFLQLRTV